jgi:catechol 2,3-dioxygenase-like lactoylglutathione lyase family enzyme
MHRWVALAVAVLLCPFADAETRRVDAALASTRDAGWIEAVISVRDPEPLLRFFDEVAGWRETTAATMDPALARVYLCRAPQRPVREWFVTDSTRAPGFIRLVSFKAADPQVIRSAAQPWDTGGLLSLMTRTNDTRGVYAAAQRLGWSAYNDPVALELRDVGVLLSNVILRGPDGINISVYERLSPRMPDAPDLRRLRRPFNAMQSVRSLATARDFYERVLGFELLNAGEFSLGRRESNNFGMPANIVAAETIPFAILGPRRDGPTQVEMVELRGVEGRDLSQAVAPPNLGLFALRFPVSDLGRLEARLRAARWPLARGPAHVRLEPYGNVRWLAVQSPDGAWLEFFETEVHKP